MKGQFYPMLEGNMQLELIQVDRDGVRFGTFPHFFTPQKLVEKTEDFARGTRYLKKCHGTYRDKRSMHLKLYQCQNETLRR
jgi:hypothetical protein